MNLGSFFLTLGFKADMATLKGFNAGIGNLSKSIVALQGVAAGALYGLDRFLAGTIKNTTALSNFNTQTGLSTQKLQAWQRVAAITGDLSSSTIQSGIASLSKKIGPDGDTFEFLERLRGTVRGMSSTQATSLVESLGLDAGFVNVLKLTREEFDKLGHNRFLSKGQIDSITKLGQSVSGLKDNLLFLKDKAIADMAPQLNNLVNSFQSWVDINYDKIVEGLKFITSSTTDFIGAVKNITTTVGEGVGSLFGTKGNDTQNTLLGIGTLATLAFPGKALGIGALLVADDILNHFQGNPSTTTDFLNAIDKWADAKNTGSLQAQKENSLIHNNTILDNNDPLVTPSNLNEYIGSNLDQKNASIVINVNSTANANEVANQVANQIPGALRRAGINNSIR